MGARATTGSEPLGSELDPTIYPVSDAMGEGVLQMLIVELLRPLVERWLRSRGKRWFVGADQFIYWEKHSPTTSVAPDVYVLRGVAPDTVVGCWKVWETGVIPCFAFEVVSSDRLKDYERAPARYQELGVSELIIFDPEHERSRERCRWQVLRRDREGHLILVEATNADRVRSRQLACWLRAVGTHATVRVRVASGLRGDDLLPTEAEHALHEAAEQRAARSAAETENARLRAELARRDATSKRPRKRG